jgi:hypothetical protein
MRSLTFCLLSCAALLPGPAAAATPETEAFGQCLVGKTSGDDRLLLARWITFAFASHPVVQDTVSIDPTKLAETDAGMAGLVMSLLTERCTVEAKAAVAAEGDAGIALQKAFEMLGMVASQEVMMDASAQERINAFAGYLDEGRLTSALAP